MLRILLKGYLLLIIIYITGDLECNHMKIQLIILENIHHE